MNQFQWGYIHTNDSLKETPTEYERGKQAGVDSAIIVVESREIELQQFNARHGAADNDMVARENEARIIASLIRRYAMGGPGVKI